MKSKYWISIVIITALTIVLNIIAFSKSFCDWYTVTVYRAINAVVGTLTGWFKLPLGEIIMYVGALVLVMIPVLGIVRIILLKKKAYKNFYNGYLKICLMTIMLFLLVYTTNWFIPIRGNVLKIEDNTRTVFTDEELEQLRTEIVYKMNEIAAQIPRDENGIVISEYSQKDIAAYMAARGDEFPKLKGHYSQAKESICSPILDMMGIGGYNYIYTMEPSYNRYVDKLYSPVVICHELCHHKGYYLENEASFLSVVVLTESDNLLFQYCGYRELYAYVDNACRRNYVNTKITDPNLKEEFLAVAASINIDTNREYSDSFMARLLYNYNFPQLDDIVWDDIENARNESDELYHSEVNAKVEEAISEPVTQVADKGWEVQSNILKENIYDGMLLMYLQYYYD